MHACILEAFIKNISILIIRAGIGKKNLPQLSIVGSKVCPIVKLPKYSTETVSVD